MKTDEIWKIMKYYENWWNILNWCNLLKANKILW